MRFVNAGVGDGRPIAALLTEAGAYPLQPHRSLPELVSAGANLIELGRRAAESAESAIPLADLRLERPIEQPSTFRDFMSFEQHIANARGQRPVDIWYEQPTFYFSNPTDLKGPRDEVEIFPGSSQFDYELEIGAILGRSGRDLTPDEAEAAILGYVLLCDWSARDLQIAEMAGGLGPAKGKDGATSLGGVVVTPDELEHLRSGRGYDLSLTASVNGVEYSSGNWRDIHWSFGQMISYASRGAGLRVGDLIGSGTVGSGSIGEMHRISPRPWLAAGDRVVLDGGILGSIDAVVRAGRTPWPLSSSAASADGGRDKVGQA